MAEQTIAILGLGLMGGSLAMGLRAGDYAGRVVGFARRAETRRAAVEKGIVDAVFDTACDAVRDADMVVLCVPVLATVPLLESCLPGFKTGAVVTDVGSTKATLAACCRAVLAARPVSFVGSHPMAGSEATGLAAARTDLYRNATVVLTPDEDTPPPTVASVSALWRRLGARVIFMTAAAHDRMVARTSHVPHLVAAALAGSVCRDDADIAPFCGSGFRDTTRIAAGSEAIWHDIVETNHDAIRSELDAFMQALRHMEGLVEQGDFEGVRAFLSDSRRRRERVVHGHARDREGSRHA